MNKIAAYALCTCFWLAGPVYFRYSNGPTPVGVLAYAVLGGLVVTLLIAIVLVSDLAKKEI